VDYNWLEGKPNRGAATKDCSRIIGGIPELKKNTNRGKESKRSLEITCANNWGAWAFWRVYCLSKEKKGIGYKTRSGLYGNEGHREKELNMSR